MGSSLNTNTTAQAPLLSPSKFNGLDGVVHLSAGGETPALRSHQEATLRFFTEKSQGERARALFADKVEVTRAQCAQLFMVNAGDITFLSSASDGINTVMYGMQWEQGDNVVIADVEFPSGAYPWSLLTGIGVEVRVAKHKDWKVSLDDIADLIDERTRIVLISHVSMFTGQRIDLEKLSKIVRRSRAKLVLDATHAAGVVPVDAALADVVVSSCYKWLLGVHGTAIFYWNRERFPELEPAFLGWNSVSSFSGWSEPLSFELKPDTHRFQPANPDFLGIYLLNNALDTLLPLGREAICEHALAMTGVLHEALSGSGFEVMTPAPAEERAGNVCIMSDRVDELAASLKARNVLVWGTYASAERLRISAHVYNSLADIEACIASLQSAKASV